MTPSYLLAVLPPPELDARIRSFRTAHELKDAAAVPHITLKARSGLLLELDWQEKLHEVVAQHAPLPMSVGGPRLFSNGTALYLEADSSEAVQLHLALLEVLKPARFFGYEGPGLQLHLSLALQRRGVELSGLLTAAQAEFADLEREPHHFTAHTISLMRKPGPGGIYAPLQEWPLLG